MKNPKAMDETPATTAVAVTRSRFKSEAQVNRITMMGPLGHTQFAEIIGFTS